MDVQHEGGCFCGAIRYAFSGVDVPCADCHCSMCRRISGAPYVSWLVVPESDFAYTKGQPKTLASSEDGTRYFCSDCGTPLACTNRTHPGIIDITLGSLDNPAAFTPVHTVFEDTRLPFVTTHALSLKT